MTTISEASFRQHFYVKKRPLITKGDFAGYGGKAGWVVAALPKEYPVNSAQQRVIDFAKECGLKKGMSRAAVLETASTCMKEQWDTYRGKGRVVAKKK